MDPQRDDAADTPQANDEVQPDARQLASLTRSRTSRCIAARSGCSTNTSPASSGGVVGRETVTPGWSSHSDPTAPPQLYSATH